MFLIEKIFEEPDACTLLHHVHYVVPHARKTLRVSTTATIAQILAVPSKEGAVIGAVLSTRKFHRGHH
jgi:hypothetical protein